MKNLKCFLLISLLAVLILPNFAHALTAEELIARIRVLEQELAQLKAQLAQLQGETPEWCHDFIINLKIGAEGKEVEALHTALEKDGFVILAIEKLQKEFGESTASAVSGFQQKYLNEVLTPWGLKYGTGFVGSTTRAKLNNLYGCETKGIATPYSVEGIISTAPVSAGQIAQITGDYTFHFCIRKIDGSVFCKGKEMTGKEDVFTAVSGLTDAANIVIGSFDHKCAVKTDGSAVCWGNNKYGQLGDGTITYRSTPVQVSGLGPNTTAAIAIAMNHTCALKTNGSVVCWGLNMNGQLGDGTIEEKLTPTQVSGLGPGTTAAIFTDLFGVNPNGTCAIKTNGAVVCWGEIAPIGFAGNTTPVAVSQITPGTAKYLEFGFKNTFVLKKDGSAIAWGSNYCGQLGNGTKEGGGPTQVYGLGPGTTVAISFGSYNGCALKTDGSVVCWGCNNSGEVGDGTMFPRFKPVQVPGLGPGTTAAITVGNSGGCALKTDGSIVCWPGTQEKDVESGYLIGKLTPVSIPDLDQILNPASYCSDGTFYNQCSTTKPKYCTEGTLYEKCEICGCDTGFFCHLDGKCAKEK